MLRRILTALLLFCAATLLFSQDKPLVKEGGAANGDKPLQAIHSDNITIQQLTFNKKIDPRGQGELLQVEFALENNADNPQDLYIWVLAYVNEKDWQYNTLHTKKLSIKEIKNKYFAPVPNDRSQFEYGDAGLKKFPKDPKKGIDPNTGKPYHLDSYLPVRTDHLSKYRKRYEYFNYVTIFIFDSEGECIFYDNYSLDAKRTR